MNKYIYAFIFSILALGSCQKNVQAPKTGEEEIVMIPAAEIDQLAAEVASKFPAEERERLLKGVKQVAKMWRAEDGSPADLKAFCLANYQADSAKRLELLKRFDRYVELLYGYEIALTRELRETIDLAGREPQNIDEIFFAYNPFVGVTDDLFKNKIAFIALLNFPQKSLEELNAQAATMSREEWAMARLVKRYGQRLPAAPKMAVNEAMAAAESYINNYNINLSNVLDGQGQKLFPAGKKLIAHWGLRDELKALYADREHGLDKQRQIMAIMEQIINQSIPAQFVNSDELQYDVYQQKLLSKEGQPLAARSEEDSRYQKLLDIFHAMREVDRYSPDYPSHVARIFSLEREMAVEEVESLLTEVLAAPLGADVAALIKNRLGRDLEPFDIWYDGFKARAAIPEAQLDRMVRAEYADNVSFQQKMPEILKKLQFNEELANFLPTKISVDAARGAGHAMQAGMRSDKAHLRTRVPAGGLDYKGFNIAMHELGHNVEEVLSLNRIDWVLLAGIPNTAFTEAFAFLFQARDLEVLGIEQPAESRELTAAMNTLDVFWDVREIAGVALLDIQVWKYMYAHPDLDKKELKAAVIKMARELWQKYYAPVLGTADSPLLAIYSHMICYGLYLPDYPLGYLIQYQLSAAMQGKNFGDEFYRMATGGALTPQAWMERAVGGPLSAKPLLTATQEALELLKKEK